MSRLRLIALLAGVALASQAAGARGASALRRFDWKETAEGVDFAIEFEGSVTAREHDQLVDRQYYYVDFYGASGPEQAGQWDFESPSIRHVKRFYYPKQRVVRFVFYPKDAVGSRFSFEGTGASYKVAARPFQLRPLGGAGEDPKTVGSRKLVILDPGHGGFSEGAKSPQKIDGQIRQEKDIVLQIAKRMVPLFEKSPNLEVRLTRQGDDYVSLEDRIRFADKARGDLFMSLHMNATDERKKPRGFEVYYLSDENRAANHLLEQLENDRGEKLEAAGKAGSQVKSILASLSADVMRQRRQESIQAALVVDEVVRREGPFKSELRGIKSAAFRVLLNGNMPSVLCEMGFIDNAEDAAMMIQPRIQEQVAVALFNAINLYFARTDPEFKPRLAQMPAAPPPTERVAAAPPAARPSPSKPAQKKP